MFEKKGCVILQILVCSYKLSVQFAENKKNRSVITTLSSVSLFCARQAVGLRWYREQDEGEIYNKRR